MRPINPIEIELGVPFITPKCATRILRTVVELLMYQRNQIPCLYTSFRTMIKTLELNENKPFDETATARVQSMRLAKERTQAKEAFYNTEILFDTIDKILIEHTTVREVMVLFGRTIYTAKEAIVINLPPINANHPGHSPQLPMNRRIAKTLSLSNENIENIQVHDTTNMFVLIKPLLVPQQIGNGKNIYRLDEFKLPSKCVQFVINLKTLEMMAEESATKCEKFLIFEEEHEASSMTDNQRETTIETDDKTCWHQLDVVVKGFKPSVRKGSQIWE